MPYAMFWTIFIKFKLIATTRQSWQISNDDEKLWQISWNKWQTKLPYISDHPYRILFNGVSEPGKMHVTELVTSTRYWQNSFIHQRFTQIKASMFY